MPNTGDMQFANKGASELLVALLPADTQITVVDPSTFPAIGLGQNFLVVVETLNLSAFEVLRVTSVTGNVFQVDRGVGGTTVGTFAIGNNVENRVTMSTLDDFVNDININAQGIADNLQSIGILATAIDDHVQDLNDPHDVQAVQVGYDPTADKVTSAVAVQPAMVAHSESIQKRVSSMSGIIQGGSLSEASPTTINITDGNGIIFDSYTNPEVTSAIPVVWVGLNNIVVNMVGEVGRTFIYINSVGAVLEAAGPISGVLYRENIFLGIAYHLNGVITEVVNAPSVIKQTATDLYDDLFQSIEVAGAALMPVTAALSIWSESGSFFFPGVNWELDRANPNNQTIVQEGDSATPIPMYAMTQDGQVADVPITVIPKETNPSGAVLDSMNGTEATIHRLYSLGFGETVGDRKFVLLYGQNVYGNAQIAKANLEVDASQTFFPPDLATLVFLAYVCLEDNSTDFDDINDAWIVNDVGGGGVQSGGASQADHTILVNRDALNQHPIESIGTSAGEQLRTTLDLKAAIAGYQDDGWHEEYTGDLDDIAVNSSYSFNTGTATGWPTDLPTGTNIVATEWVSSGNAAFQTILGPSDGDLTPASWMRIFFGTWEPWVKVVDGGAFTERLAGYEDTGFHDAAPTDLNTILSNSVWLTPNPVTNAPSDFLVGGRGFIETLMNSATFGSQVLYGRSGGNQSKIWMRYLNTTWAAWHLVVDGSTLTIGSTGIRTFVDQVRTDKAAPVNVKDLTRKDYVDSRDSLAMPKTGGTFTGAIKGPNPTVDTDLATKAYVDNNAGSEKPVGALEFGYNPNGILDGVWTQLPEGTFIMSTVGGADPSGGSNDAANISHNHSASQGAHSHAATQAAHNHSASQGAHSHAATQAAHNHSATQGSHGHGLLASKENGNWGGRIAYTSATNNLQTNAVQAASAGAITVSSVTPAITVPNATPAITVLNTTPAITVPNAQPAITVNSAGVSGTNRNRPKYKGVQVWERTS